MHTLSGNILTPAGWQHGALQFDHLIRQIQGQPCSPQTNSDRLILPGFIDLHVHGGGGRDVMEGGDAIDTICRTHARHGTTSLLATTMTAPLPDIRHALLGVARGMQQGVAGGADLLGVHLEGPYLSPQRLGAQPDHAHPGTLAEVEQLQVLAPLRVLTLAPELHGHLPLIAELSHRGIRVQLGHGNASYEETLAALQAGASGFTHLFNAMSPLHHRQPGMVGAALAHGEYAELIPDLLHVHPGAILAALRAIPKAYCVTDSTAATGMPDGEYQLGSHRVYKCLGGVRLADGTLAGSALTMDEALRKLVSIGLDLADASSRLSSLPAEHLGLRDRGRLLPGHRADLVVLDRALTLQAVLIAGQTLVMGQNT